MSTDPVQTPQPADRPDSSPAVSESVADAAAPAPVATASEGRETPAVEAPQTSTPVAVSQAGVPAVSAAAAVETSAPASAEPVTQGVPSAAAPPPASAPPEEGLRRKVRLAPVADPKTLRPIPNRAAGESQAPPRAESTVPPPSVEAFVPEPPRHSPVAAGVAGPSPPPPPVSIPRREELDAAMEAEIAAALQASDVPLAPAAPPAEEGAPPVTEETLEPGAKLKGTIQKVAEENVFVEFGLRMTGLVPLRQFDPQHPPQVGATVQVSVDKVDETEGLIYCNLPRGRGKVSHDWSAVVVGQTVDCQVTGVNKGGLEVTVGSLRGFLPASQVELGFVANLESYIGRQLSVRVTEVNPARRRLIVSRRLLLAEERQANEATLLAQIEPGQIRNGVVKAIKDFGAFIDLGGIDGFLHVGQISWQRINKPSDVLSEGQGVEVKVLSVDREKKRISLSLRQLEQNPWATVEEKYAKGSQVTGRVTRIEPFGAFVELEPGVEGLVHISELDHKRVRKVEDVVSLNQMVELKVLEVDPKKRRISLSAKALKARPEEAPQESPAAPAAPPPERKAKVHLKGGIGGQTQGGLFGDPRQYS